MDLHTIADWPVSAIKDIAHKFRGIHTLRALEGGLQHPVRQTGCFQQQKLVANTKPVSTSKTPEVLARKVRFYLILTFKWGQHPQTTSKGVQRHPQHPSWLSFRITSSCQTNWDNWAWRGRRGTGKYQIILIFADISIFSFHQHFHFSNFKPSFSEHISLKVIAMFKWLCSPWFLLPG